jgi:hypothetical protein
MKGRRLKMKRIRIVFVVLVWAGISQADTLVAYWDFGSDATNYTENVSTENAIGTPTLTGMSAGSGYDTNGQDGVSFVDSEGSSHPAGQALAWGSGVNDADQEWVLAIDLTGYQNLILRWDYRSTSTGPTNAVLEYKVGTGDWSLVEAPSFTRDSSYHAYQKDLSAISAINNQSAVQFRLSGFSGGSGSGTYRTDNLQLSTIPEPAVMGLIGLVSLAFLATHRFFGK